MSAAALLVQWAVSTALTPTALRNAAIPPDVSMTLLHPWCQQPQVKSRRAFSIIDILLVFAVFWGSSFKQDHTFVRKLAVLQWNSFLFMTASTKTTTRAPQPTAAPTMTTTNNVRTKKWIIYQSCEMLLLDCCIVIKLQKRLSVCYRFVLIYFGLEKCL